MSDRYDFVVYGATGFTGKFVVEQIAKKKNKVHYAVAGRNTDRMKRVLEEVTLQTGVDQRQVPIIVADSGDEHSLRNMARQAKVIINTVGPYRLYGESVVKAAVEEGAHHVDISGEPHFLERMQLKYDSEAKKKGVYIVGSCGWDSIPCDLGISFLKREFCGQLGGVETFVQFNSGSAGYSINAGTYQTLVLGFANMKSDKLGDIRKQTMPQKLPNTGYKPQKRPTLWYNEKLQGWCLPFLGSDKSVAKRSEYFNYCHRNESPAYIETYLVMKSLFWAVLLMMWLYLFTVMSQFRFTRSILQKYPDYCSFGLFKEAGPTKEQIDQASFSYWFHGWGWKDPVRVGYAHPSNPDRFVAVRCDGPDCGYISTSACVLSAAETLLEDAASLPLGGGVFTPAAAFARTRIYDRLADRGKHCFLEQSVNMKIFRCFLLLFALSLCREQSLLRSS
ncbi:hypothetical protein AB6A40_004670 [Gnathostoma spinigerum]|uniref:Saccharopine dehydrogenase NADP binding domain-containing protein n=1 Tax=Gnathostoma spinigerum TaxID=75299 RepID=A0ABD6EE83_9BILA